MSRPNTDKKLGPFLVMFVAVVLIIYSFNLPDGKEIDGFTYKIGNATYIKVSKSDMNIVPVRYFKAIPQINALESDAGIKLGNFIIIGAGIVLIKLISSGKHKNRVSG